MLSPQTSILVYGLDAALLETRRRVLELSGARVWVATEFFHFDQITRAMEIDLIVLCHSLSTKECDGALALARSRWPQVQSLALLSGQRGCEFGPSEQVVDTAAGPAHLLRTVFRLLNAAAIEPHPTANSDSRDAARTPHRPLPIELSRKWTLNNRWVQ
jgi:hypothetical protein